MAHWGAYHVPGGPQAGYAASNWVNPAGSRGLELIDLEMDDDLVGSSPLGAYGQLSYDGRRRRSDQRIEEEPPSLATFVDEPLTQQSSMDSQKFESYYKKKKVYHKLRHHMKVCEPAQQISCLKGKVNLRYYRVMDESEKSLYFMCAECRDQKLYQTIQKMERHAADCTGILKEVMDSQNRQSQNSQPAAHYMQSQSRSAHHRQQLSPEPVRLTHSQLQQSQYQQLQRQPTQQQRVPTHRITLQRHHSTSQQQPMHMQGSQQHHHSQQQQHTGTNSILVPHHSRTQQNVIFETPQESLVIGSQVPPSQSQTQNTYYSTHSQPIYSTTSQNGLPMGAHPQPKLIIEPVVQGSHTQPLIAVAVPIEAKPSTTTSLLLPSQTAIPASTVHAPPIPTASQESYIPSSQPAAIPVTQAKVLLATNVPNPTIIHGRVTSDGQAVKGSHGAHMETHMEPRTTEAQEKDNSQQHVRGGELKCGAAAGNRDVEGREPEGAPKGTWVDTTHKSLPNERGTIAERTNEIVKDNSAKISDREKDDADECRDTGEEDDGEDDAAAFEDFSNTYEEGNEEVAKTSKTSKTGGLNSKKMDQKVSRVNRKMDQNGTKTNTQVTNEYERDIEKREKVMPGTDREHARNAKGKNNDAAARLNTAESNKKNTQVNEGRSAGVGDCDKTRDHRTQQQPMNEKRKGSCEKRGQKYEKNSDSKRTVSGCGKSFVVPAQNDKTVKGGNKKDATSREGKESPPCDRDGASSTEHDSPQPQCPPAMVFRPESRNLKRRNTDYVLPPVPCLGLNDEEARHDEHDNHQLRQGNHNAHLKRRNTYAPGTRRKLERNDSYVHPPVPRQETDAKLLKTLGQGVPYAYVESYAPAFYDWEEKLRKKYSPKLCANASAAAALETNSRSARAQTNSIVGSAGPARKEKRLVNVRRGGGHSQWALDKRPSSWVLMEEEEKNDDTPSQSSAVVIGEMHSAVHDAASSSVIEDERPRDTESIVSCEVRDEREESKKMINNNNNRGKGKVGKGKGKPRGGLKGAQKGAHSICGARSMKGGSASLTTTTIHKNQTRKGENSAKTGGGPKAKGRGRKVKGNGSVWRHVENPKGSSNAHQSHQSPSKSAAKTYGKGSKPQQQQQQQLLQQQAPPSSSQSQHRVAKGNSSRLSEREVEKREQEEFEKYFSKLRLSHLRHISQSQATSQGQNSNISRGSHHQQREQRSSSRTQTQVEKKNEGGIKGMRSSSSNSARGPSSSGDGVSRGVGSSKKVDREDDTTSKDVKKVRTDTTSKAAHETHHAHPKRSPEDIKRDEGGHKVKPTAGRGSGKRKDKHVAPLIPWWSPMSVSYGGSLSTGIIGEEEEPKTSDSDKKRMRIK